jgi:uncharacterized membrane protein YozB (DUF420 family)
MSDDGAASTLHRASGITLLVLSVAAAVIVLVGASAAIASGPPPASPHDEGTGAHLFQLSVAGAGLAGVVFLATIDRRGSARAAKTLALAAACLALAFAVLFWFEKVLGY